MPSRSYHRRRTGLTEEALGPPDGGMNQDVSPDRVPQNQAPLLENFLTDQKGKIRMRGPVFYANNTSLFSGTNKAITGMMMHGDIALIGLRALEDELTTIQGTPGSPAGTREYWVNPYRPRGSAIGTPGAAAPSNTNLKRYDAIAGTVSNVSWGLGQTPGPRWTRHGLFTYAIAYDSLAPDLGTLPTTQQALLRWDGSTSTPAYLSNAPRGAFDLKSHLNRLFLLGGMDINTGLPVDSDRNTIRWSNPGTPGGAAMGSGTNITDWQDPTSVLTPKAANGIVVESDNQSDFGVALAKVGQNLAIFKRHSVHMLLGATPATFVVRQIENQLGCLDARSVAEYQGGTFYLSQEGLMFFNGVQSVNVSGGLRTAINTAAAACVGDAGVDGGYAIAQILPNGFLMLQIGAQSFVDGSNISLFSGYMNLTDRSWSLFSSAAMRTTPLQISRGMTTTLGWDSDILWRMDYITQPDQIAAAGRGYDRGYRSAAIFDKRIPSKWYSQLFRMATPLNRAQLHRYMIDYSFVREGGAEDALQGWFVKLVDGQGTVLVPEYQLPIQANPTINTYRRRHNQDVFTETRDVQLQLQYKDDGSGTTPAISKAEIYDSYLQYQSAYRMTGQ